VEPLRAAGGFASPSITEDIELSWRLQKTGHRLVYVPRALAWVNVPEHLPGLWRQRVRWSQGLTEVLRLHGNGWRARALRVFATEAALCMTWLVLLAWSLACGAVALLLQPHAFALKLSLWHALGVALFLCQSATAAVLDGHYADHPWRLLPLALLYPAYFAVIILPTSLIGWVKGLFTTDTGRWERSERG
jgi:poly-beta-1,6-N-acetyl-D-glucosamine synthase